ncbi:CHAT domain-containing protein [Irpex rosettiformis]|uniref:CHAT domain-containing protein n=1 Tax=Irpex rosettiformis TaxID=378272 RepID=A0ACB8TN95_9APHY|nr:CHAT domain-containing protein [Irpex rosettiformis]
MSAPVNVGPHSPASAGSSYAEHSEPNVNGLPLYKELCVSAQQAYDQYETRGDLKVLEFAIRSYHLAMEVTEDNNPKKAAIIDNLGVSLSARFDCVGDLQDLEEAISLKQLANALTPDDSPAKHSRLSKLAISLFSRFERSGRAEDLEEAIELQTRAVKLVPDGHVDQPGLLSNLGVSLCMGFEHSGSANYLEKAIELQTCAVELTPEDHPNKPIHLINLGNSHERRFDQLGNLEDLERAVALKRRSVDLAPDSHPNKPAYLNNAGSSLQTRFTRLGDLADLERAIVLQVRAVELTSDGRPDKPMWLGNLANSLQDRYERTRDAKDLEDAITHQFRAVELTPDGHPDKPARLNNLGARLHTRFKQFGNLDDLNQAIAHYTTALTLTPEGHHDKPSRLRNLSNSLHTRFNEAGNVPDLEEAIRCSTWSVELTPENHAQRALSLRLLGFLFFTRLCSPHAHADDASCAMEAFLEAMQHPTSHPLERLRASIHYARLLTEFSHLFTVPPQLTLLEAWKHAISLVPQCIWLGNNVRSRYTSEELSVVRVVVNDAATAAITAEEFGFALDYALEYDKLMSTIRGLDGFEDFLRPKTLSQLAVLCRAGDAVHIPLPELSLNRAMDIQKYLWDLLRAKRFLSRCRGDSQDEGDERGGRVTEMEPPDMMRKVLADLWNWVVKPIMDVVCTLEPSSATLPHITWSGIYPKNEHADTPSRTIMDLAVSSYTPTLEALLKPRAQVTPDGQDPRVLIVSQPASPYAINNPIPGTTTEAAIVMSLVGESKPLDDADGTIQAVLEGMATHEWVHLACHGAQNRKDPTNSAFILHDGHLTLAELMSHHLPSADLAVLSACQTATGDENLSEEAVHLTAGMLNIGYKSVIGTMWSISDFVAPDVMRVFYTVMAEQVKAGGELQPAYALHEAIKVWIALFTLRFLSFNDLECHNFTVLFPVSLGVVVSMTADFPFIIAADVAVTETANPLRLSISFDVRGWRGQGNDDVQCVSDLETQPNRERHKDGAYSNWNSSRGGANFDAEKYILPGQIRLDRAHRTVELTCRPYSPPAVIRVK